MIVETVFLSILNTNGIPFGSENRKETRHHDHIPFNVKGNEIRVFSEFLIVVGLPGVSRLSSQAGLEWLRDLQLFVVSKQTQLLAPNFLIKFQNNMKYTDVQFLNICFRIISWKWFPPLYKYNSSL